MLLIPTLAKGIPSLDTAGMLFPGDSPGIDILPVGPGPEVPLSIFPATGLLSCDPKSPDVSAGTNRPRDRPSTANHVLINGSPAFAAAIAAD